MQLCQRQQRPIFLQYRSTEVLFFIRRIPCHNITPSLCLGRCLKIPRMCLIHLPDHDQYPCCIMGYFQRAWKEACRCWDDVIIVRTSLKGSMQINQSMIYVYGKFKIGFRFRRRLRRRHQLVAEPFALGQGCCRYWTSFFWKLDVRKFTLSWMDVVDRLSPERISNKLLIHRPIQEDLCSVKLYF